MPTCLRKILPSPPSIPTASSIIKPQHEATGAYSTVAVKKSTEKTTRTKRIVKWTTTTTRDLRKTGGFQEKRRAYKKGKHQSPIKFPTWEQRRDRAKDGRDSSAYGACVRGAEEYSGRGGSWGGLAGNRRHARRGDAGCGRPSGSCFFARNVQLRSPPHPPSVPLDVCPVLLGSSRVIFVVRTLLEGSADRPTDWTAERSYGRNPEFPTPPSK